MDFMPVLINYTPGRDGNKMFQYVSARIFSEKNGLNLITNLSCELVTTKKHISFDDDFDRNKNVKVTTNDFSENEINFKGKSLNYIFDDYFTNGDYISNNKELVRNFFELPKVEKNLKDIVIHLRLYDFSHSNYMYEPTNWDRSEVISPDYYTKILENETFEKLYIVVDEIRLEWEKKYLDFFKKYNPIIFSSSPKEDFEFIFSFDKIICSNSSFCYWAAFLSDASKIYTFKKFGYFGKNLTKHGPWINNLDNIKNESISIDDTFFWGFDY